MRLLHTHCVNVCVRKRDQCDGHKT